MAPKIKITPQLKYDIEKEKCRRSSKYFIENYVHIEDRDSDELAVLFKLWPDQGKVLELFEKQRLSILLKARQLGFSWLCLSYAVRRMIFKTGYSVVALSKREDDAKELSRRVVFVLRYMPEWFIRDKKTAPTSWKGMTWESTSLQITINHPNGEPSIFSSLTSSPDSGRSLTANLIILDEWAFQEYASKIWAAAYPTINRPTGGQVIGLSTAKRGTFFNKIWDEAMEGLNGFTPIFLPWSADPRRTQEWYEATKKALPVDGDSDANYHTEYPETSEEAFMYAGNAVFNVEKLTNRIKLLRHAYKENPPARGNIESMQAINGDPIKGAVKFIHDENGWLTVYEMPVQGNRYVIGGDISEGGIDWSVGQVIDNATGNQVATWRAHTDTDLFAKQMFSLGHFYNEALIAIEINFDTHPVKELIRLGYHRQYKREVVDSISKKREQKYGWRTTSSSRPLAIGELVSVVRENIDSVNDLTTLSEMLSFIRGDTGRPEAQQGKHDDAVIALAIAYMARGQQLFSVKEKGPELPKGLPDDLLSDLMQDPAAKAHWLSMRAAQEGAVTDAV